MIKINHKIQKYVYLETFVITFVFIILGYLFQPNDILLIEKDLFLLTGFLSVLTLFFGLGSGLFSLSMLTIIMFSGYETFEYQLFLKELVLIFIFGEFHSFWHKKVMFYRQKMETLETHFQDVSKAFYALKISHDQLEMNYVLKPVSLRHSLVQIVDNMHEENADHWQNLAVLFEKTFGITKLNLCMIEEGRCISQIVSGKKSISMEDSLIQKALKSTLPVYIPEHVNETSEYVAVIPAVFQNEVKAMLLIEEMPFMSFKEDNLIAIRFIFDYFFLLLHHEKVLRDSSLVPQLGDSFRFAYIDHYQLFQRYNVNSAFIVFKLKDALVHHRLNGVIEETLRDLDQYDTLSFDEGFISVVMTPFSEKESSKGLEKRILENLREEEMKSLEITFFTFEEKELFERYIERF